VKLASGIIAIVIGIALLVWVLVASPFGSGDTVAIIVALIVIGGGAARIYEAVTGRTLPISFGSGSDGPLPGPGGHDHNDFPGGGPASGA
jgi:hypothetical protein